MSELTRCNYCSLRIIRKEAKEKKLKVTLLAGWHGGIDAYMHPKNVTRQELQACREKTWGDIPNSGPGKYWAAWFMEITNHCCC